MEELDGKDMGGARLEVSLAKPPSDKKKKEEILRARERRMTQMIYGRGGWVVFYVSEYILVISFIVLWWSGGQHGLTRIGAISE